MESVGAAEIINSEVDSQSSNSSCFDKITDLEAIRLGTFKVVIANNAEKVENPLDSVSRGNPSWKNCKDSQDQDAVLLVLSNGIDSSPSTPFSDREMVESSSSSYRTEDEDMVSGCQTPIDSTFDPFAPGPEELMFAPKKKPLRGSHIFPRRQLNFDLHCDLWEKVDTKAEDCFLESVCDSFLELIISNQVNEICAEKLIEEANLSKGLKTPTCLPLLSGIAETCPAPPVPTRPILKSRRLDLSICRKLQFGSDLI